MTGPREQQAQSSIQPFVSDGEFWDFAARHGGMPSSVKVGTAILFRSGARIFSDAWGTECREPPDDLTERMRIQVGYLNHRIPQLEKALKAVKAEGRVAEARRLAYAIQECRAALEQYVAQLPPEPDPAAEAAKAAELKYKMDAEYSQEIARRRRELNAIGG